MSSQFHFSTGAPETGGARSNAIWGDCPGPEITARLVPGTLLQDDFHRGVADLQFYDHIVSANSTVAEGESATGTVVLKTHTGANDYAYMIHGNGKAGMLKAVSGGRFWFEARLKVASVADCAIQVGLALATPSATFAAAGAITNTTGVPSTTNGSYILFRTVAADPDMLDCVYATAGTAETVFQAGTTGLFRDAASTVRLQTITADTFVKVGIYGDGKAAQFFVDGVAVKSTPVLYNATNFPDGVIFQPFFGIKTFSGEKTMTIDWNHCAYQEPA